MAKKPSSPPPPQGLPPREQLLREAAVMTREDLENLREAHPGLARFIELLAREAMEAEAREKAERTLARTDTRTGAHNLLSLKEEMGRTFEALGHKDRDPEKAKHISLVFLDLNDFGQVNKAIEDYAGDIGLEAVGEFFRKKLRKEDFFARKGGDEFVIIMRCPVEEAQKRMTALKSEFRSWVTKAFQARFAEAIKEDGASQKALNALSAKIAEKHRNPALAEKPFEFRFSFGCRELTHEEITGVDPKNMKSVGKFMGELFRESDSLMREQKSAYVNYMENYPEIPDPDGPAGAHSSRARGTSKGNKKGGRAA